MLHLAIIPDGNRRWARQRMLLPWNGHEKAVENFSDLITWCRKSGQVSVLTVWCFSTENWNREKKEVDMLMKLYEDYLRKERPTFTKENMRFVHSGRLDRIPSSLAALIKEVQEETEDYDGFTLNLAVDYGGKNAIVRAVKKIVEEGTDVDEESFRTYLDHPELPDMDLIIRTSGEQRTSNFFLWEGAYAEWIFLQKYFPDLTTDDLRVALEDFAKRKRRFGGG